MFFYTDFVIQNSRKQHTKQDKIGHMFRLIKHHQAIINNIEENLNTAVGARSPSLHKIMRCKYIQNLFQERGFNTKCLCIQSVTGGMCETSGECSLGQTTCIPI